MPSVQTMSVGAENAVLRDIARWFTTVIIPVLLIVVLGWVAWLNQTVNSQTTNQSVMLEKINNGQEQRQSDNLGLKSSIDDLRKSMSELKGSIDSLQTTTAAQQATLAILMQDARDTRRETNLPAPVRPDR